MKKYYLLLIFFTFIKIDAQTINFNSLNFKDRLLIADINNMIAKDSDGNYIIIDKNQDAEIQLSEALKVVELDVSSSYIVDISGIEFFTNLKSLVCWGASINTLNINALKELTYLNCSGNSIISLDVSQLKNLETLICAGGQLKSVNLKGLTKLHHLHLDRNLLDDLDLSGLENLKYIDVGYNNFKKLDLTGLTKLEDLICNESKIETLTNLTNCPNLTRLWVQDNMLNSLDLSKCSSLTDLWADNNNLTTIDLTTPKNIRNASFGKNKLTSVYVSDYSNIEFIRLSDNNFVSIDLSKFVNISNVECKNNSQLTTLFLKNGRNEYVDFEGCPNLKYICNDDIKDSGVDVYIKYYNYNILVNSYCTFEPGGVFYTIQGETSSDLDSNGCDSNDQKYSNLNFSITNDIVKGNFISDSSGNYELPLGEGTYKIAPVLENPSYFTVSPESLSVTFPDQNSPFTQNFCVIPNGSHQDLEISILPLIPARPGFDATYKIVFKNKGNQVKSGKVTFDFNDAVLDYVSSVPVHTSQTNNKLVWDYIDLKPFETREITLTLNVNSPMETPAVNIDDRLSFNVLITPVADDEKPVDNSFALRQKVVGSYDPNDKTCLEGDIVTPGLIGEYVHYLIRFENTGTYPAENIVVKDMIDLSKFDISTLVPTIASHPYTTKIFDGNKVEFIFEKINLPFDDANNDGYIAFKIKTLPTLEIGDSFENEANIYFDYNFPILTNKATSTFKTLGTQDFEFSKYINIYPIPVTSILNISSKSIINIDSITIYNVLGQVVIEIPNVEKTQSIDVSKLGPGNYFIKVISDKGSSTSKFIKM